MRPHVRTIYAPCIPVIAKNTKFGLKYGKHFNTDVFSLFFAFFHIQCRILRYWTRYYSICHYTFNEMDKSDCFMIVRWFGARNTGGEELVPNFITPKLPINLLVYCRYISIYMINACMRWLKMSMQELWILSAPTRTRTRECITRLKRIWGRCFFTKKFRSQLRG